MFVGIIVVILILLLFAFLCVMAKFTVRPKVHTLAYELDYINSLDYMKEEDLHIENEHTVRSFDGYEMWTGFLPGDANNDHYVILSHGYSSCRYGMCKYAVLWRRMGYHCVIYDNRGHGVNTPSPVSFGLRESKDLMAVIEDTRKRYGADIHIGLHGESMGSGLQLMALAHHPKVDFIINDCGYAEILPVLRWKAKSCFHLPEIVADLASPIAKLLYGYSFQEIRPIDNLKENEIPICFVHGTEDNFIHYSHSQRMYEADKGYKEMHLYENADHARAVSSDPERYYRMMQEFAAKVYAD